MKGLIFDLDQTLVNSAISEDFRSKRNWPGVYSLIPKFEVYQGVNDLIELVRMKGYLVAIVTNSPSVYTNKVIDYFSIHCDYKVCFHDVSKRKPYPDAYLRVIRELNLSKEETFALGDRNIDIQAAHAAEIASCACYWGTADPNSLRLSNPSCHFETVSDAIHFFNGK